MAPDSPDSPGSAAPSWPDDPDRPPATAEQALDVVRSRYAQPTPADGGPAELQVHEFDEGFLVYPVYPPSTDADGRPRPAPPGGGKVVVCKETGSTVTTPNLPTDAAIALYRRSRAPEQ